MIEIKIKFLRQESKLHLLYKAVTKHSQFKSNIYHILLESLTQPHKDQTHNKYNLITINLSIGTLSFNAQFTSKKIILEQTLMTTSYYPKSHSI